MVNLITIKQHKGIMAFTNIFNLYFKFKQSKICCVQLGFNYVSFALDGPRVCFPKCAQLKKKPTHGVFFFGGGVGPLKTNPYSVMLHDFSLFQNLLYIHNFYFGHEMIVIIILVITRDCSFMTFYTN